MRVTSNSFPGRLIDQLGDLATRQARLQNQAATGQRIQLPEDDPRSIRRVLDMQTDARSLDQYQKNITRLQEAASASYTAMRSLKRLGDSAAEFATRAQGVNSQPDLTVFAKQVNQLLEQAVQTANTKHRGDYLFAGTKLDKPPFVVAKNAEGDITSVTYQGNSEAVESEIGPDVLASVQAVGVNNSSTGPRGLFTDARSGSDVFAHLISLRDHLLAGDTAAVGAIDRQNLANDEANYLHHYGLNGATQSRLEAAAALSKDQSFSIEQQVSREVDADLAQTLVRLNETQNAYQAALQSGGTIMSQSLLDYLR